MEGTNRTRPAGLMRLVVGVWMIGLVAGTAFAQPAGPPDKAAGQDQKKESTSSSEAKASSQPGTRTIAPRRGAARQKTEPVFEMNPNAKWVCEDPVDEIEPVWRSKKSLDFSFNIRNAGTEPLAIRAKGG